MIRVFLSTSLTLDQAQVNPVYGCLYTLSVAGSAEVSGLLPPLKTSGALRLL